MTPIYIPLFNSTNLSHNTILTVNNLHNYAKKNQLPMMGIVEDMNFFSMLNFSFKLIPDGIKPIIGCKINCFYENKPWGSLTIFIQNNQGFSDFSKVMSDSYRLSQFHEDQCYIHLESLIPVKDIIIIITKHNKFHEKLMYNDNLYWENIIEFFKTHWPKNFYLSIDLFEEKTSFNGKRITLADLYHIPLIYYHQPLFDRVDNSLSYHVFDSIINKKYYNEEVYNNINNKKYALLNYDEIDYGNLIPEAINNTYYVGVRCTYLPKKSLQNPPFFIPDPQKEKEFLKIQSMEGLKKLLMEIDPQDHSIYYDRWAMEFKVITEKNFSGYFLIVADFINWAKNHNIAVGPGRGSGAGSIIAWSLGITDINPIFFGLIFERFLNPERVSMPDFDIDFDPKRRDEILNYVSKKYGIYNCAHIITFGLMKAKMVVRDVGRVLGFSYYDIDRIAKIIPSDQVKEVKLGEVLQNDPRMAELYSTNEKIKQLIDISLTLEGFPRTVSIHAAGYIISNKPLYNYAPFYLDREGGSLCIQLNMNQVEEVGLIKFDFLSLKTLVICQEIRKLVEERHHIRLKIDTTKFDDTSTYKLIASGLCCGIFQLESTGIQEVAMELQPDNIDDITALISLFRPGPMAHIDSFVARKHGLEPIEYDHPSLNEILKPTYGVIVYQEQVMAITQIMASYSMGKADILRKAMGKKKAEEMEKQEVDFIAGCKANKIDEKVAKKVFDQMSVFAGYAFNKAHAAAYGVITYDTAYLKTNYMEEFYTVILNNDIHDYSQMLIFILEFRKFGGIIEPPSINRSHSLFTIVDNKRIIYGLTAIRGVGVYGQKIHEEREANGLYESFQNFLYRHKEINKKVIKALIYSGCFDEFDTNRCKLMTIGEIFLETKFAVFNTMETKKWSLSSTIAYEQEAFGFFLNRTPLNVYGELLLSKKIYTIKDLLHQVHSTGSGSMKCAAVLENLKKKKTSKGTSYAFLSIMDGNNNMAMTAFSKTLNDYYDVLIENHLIIFTISGHKDNDKYRFTLKEAKSLESFLQDNYYNITIPLGPQINLRGLIDLLKKESETSKRKNISIIFQGHYKNYVLNNFIHYSKNFTDELNNLGIDYQFNC